MPKVKNTGPNSVDKHVGSRMKMLRLMRNMSQEKLGNACGITFQQVQKYEKGINGMRSSRLQQIANILGVQVSYFFEGAPISTVTGVPQADPVREVQSFLATSEGVDLMRAMGRINSSKFRRSIVDMIEHAADYHN